MDNSILKNVKKIYFIGIGGISMSAIALILKKRGFEVCGSDFSENEEVLKLKTLGINVNKGHDAKNITDDIDLVVYSKAIHFDNPEIVISKEKKINVVSRSKILGEIMSGYNDRVCVSGTHGKTTVTAIISKVMLDNKKGVTVNVGGVVPDIGGNYFIGEGRDTFIAEACEYTNSYHDFCPNATVVTNIDADHLDFFKDLDDIRASFKKFIHLLPDDGLLVINRSINRLEELSEGGKFRVVTYGESEDADYYYLNSHYDKENYQIFDVYHNKKMIGTMRQKLIGRHNARNFMAACALLMEKGFTFEEIKKSIENFTGAKRRLEVKGIINGVTYIDDYAHHPTEIEASLNAVKELKYNHLFLVFQPHTFTRTKALFEHFVSVLETAENLILAKIYPAREIDDGTISSNDIKKKIIGRSGKTNNICEYLEKFEEIRDYLLNVAKEGDIVITMGAGNINKVFNLIENKLSQ